MHVQMHIQAWRCTAIVRTANEGPVRIQYKCLVLIYVLPEMKLHVLVNSKQNYNVLSPNYHIHVSESDLYTMYFQDQSAYCSATK